MKPLSTARSHLRETRDRIRRIAGDALADGEYESAATLTSWAKVLDAWIDDPLAARPKDAAQHPRTKRSAEKAEKKITTSTRFERDGQELVKIGWSRKEDRIYEHRAPRPVLDEFCNELLRRAGSGEQLIRMDQILPIAAGNGAEVPSYQAYLILAWLRVEELVKQHGRQGYTVRQPDEFLRQVTDRFSKLPARR